MSTVHTEYGPGRIIAQETVRGRTQYRVAGAGFEVWLDETKIGGLRDENLGEDRPEGWFSDEEPAGAPRLTAEELMDGVRWDDRGGNARHAWAPMDHDNSTELPYNPDPQHDAIGSFGDDDSSTIQPIHHIDADERLRSADSLTFDGEDDDDDGPGPNPELFARQGMRREAAHPSVVWNMIPETIKKQIQKKTGLPVDQISDAASGAAWGAAGAAAVGGASRMIDTAVDVLSPGPGWGSSIRSSSVHEANPAALVGPALRVLGPMALNGLVGRGGESLDGALEATDPGDWNGMIHDAGTRPAGLSDKYIDLTASADYHNDPVAQFRHDPDAYINRIGQLMDEGLNPRFAEYMDLVEADSGIRTAAWKDVRAKAMRLKTSGAVHVKDIAPSRIMASVDGDHGTYDVTILKGASYGDQSIANWHCGCEWGRWAFKRKFSYVGRLCSHAYASYLTMQSAALQGQQPRRRGPSDMIIKKREPRDRQYPMPVFAAGLRHADALQNGPDRLTPELVVNDCDDAHVFLDVTEDERDDTGPDDVVSDQDIVHFARLMRRCEADRRPYPRQLVAFLSRYSGCADDASDDTQADYEAHDAADANEYLTELRNDADRDQEDDFGGMAERVRRIQDTVEEAREHGADASQFVAAVRRTAAPEGDSPFENAFEERANSAIDFSNNIINGPRSLYDKARNYFTRDTNNQIDTTDQENLIPDFDIGDNDFSRDGYPVPEDAPAPGTKGFAATEPNPGGTTVAPTVGAPAVNSPTVGAPQNSQGNAAGTGAGAGAGTGAGAGAGAGAAAPAGGGGWKSPPGGTSGNVADGGVVGAENGDNSAITKSMLDAEGYYTLKPGETLTDLAQRGYGDMNKYQDLAKANNITNADDLSGVTKIKMDGLNDVGNGGLAGNITNPAGGGADGDIATVDTPKGSGSGAETALNAGASIGTGAGEVNTDVAAGKPATPTPPAGGAATDAAQPPPAAPPPAAEVPPAPAPAAPPNLGKPEGALRTARDWLRWAAEGDGSGTDGTADAAATDASQPSPTAQTPGTGRAMPGSPTAEDTYDPADPAQQAQQQNSAANPGAQAAGSNSGLPSMPSMPGMGSGGGQGDGMADIGGSVGDIGGAIGGAVGSFLPGLGGAISGISSGIGGLVNGLSGLGGGGRQASTVFASERDFDEWVRYAYPAGAGDDDDPKTLPHLPFAGSGNPGALEFGTSEEYADKARKKMDDVTDLGDGDLTQSMGDWQKQGSYDGEPSDFELHLRQSEQDRMRHPMRAEDEDPYHREASIGYSTDDDSDVVRTFQAHLGETALGAGAGGGGGRFDDFAGAAQGFLRTAGRNYSLAEQDELVREGDRGGARNLASLDLKGTHYEDMNTLGW
jgi:hypothetical protein